jgi:hypothetical protein
MIATEQVFTFAELAKRLPRVGEKRIHVSTLHRWCRKGVRGVCLEFRMLGGRIVTSLEAVDRFSATLAQVTERQPRRAPRQPATRSASQRESEIARATRVLEETGI